MANEFQIFKAAFETVHDGGADQGVRVVKVASEVAHNGDPDQDIRIYKTAFEVVRDMRDAYSPAFIDDSDEIHAGFVYSTPFRWDLVESGSGIHAGFSLNQAVFTIADRERNPYAAHPDRELVEFIDEQQRILRDQHNRTQAGDTTFDYGLLLKGTADKLYTLGSLGRFYHEDYGLIIARYVQFASCVATPQQAAPVGYLKTSRHVDWIVTNDLSKSSPDQVMGVMCTAAPPADNTFGWIITEGPVPVPMNHTSGTLPPADAPYVWSGDGQADIGISGKIFARRWGRAHSPVITGGTIYVRLEGASPSWFDQWLEGSLSQLTSTVTAHGERLTEAESDITALQEGALSFDGRLSSLSQQLVTEGDARARDIESIRQLISTGTDWTAAITASANTVRGEFRVVDDDLYRLVRAAKYRADQAYARTGGDYAGLESQLNNLVGTASNISSRLDGITFDMTTTPPTDGQTVAYDLALELWVPVDRVTMLDHLTDVDVTTTPPEDGQALIWDEANEVWIPGDVASGGDVEGPAGVAPVFCVLSKTTQSLSASSQQVVDWPVEVVDTLGMHDNSTNNSRVTFPSRGYMLATFSAQFSSGTSGQVVGIIRLADSGGTEIRAWLADTDTSGGDYVTVSAIYPVSAGDYLTCLADASTARALSAESTFSVTFWPEGHGSETPVGCTVSRSTPQSFGDAKVSFDTEVIDTGGFYDPGTSTENLVIPSNGWYVITGTGRWAANTGLGRRMWITVDGVAAAGTSVPSDAAHNDPYQNAAATCYLTQGQVVNLHLANNDSATDVTELSLSLVKISGGGGASAYEIAVNNGFVGTEAEWLESLVGEQGPEGPAPDIEDIAGLQAALDSKANSSSLGTMATQNANAVAITGGAIEVTTALRVRNNHQNYFGEYQVARNVSQTTSGGRYLLLAKVGVFNHAISGSIVGRRSQGSGSAMRNSDIYVKVLNSTAGLTTVYWELRGIAGISVVEGTYNGERWYALDAVATAGNAAFDGATFTGTCTNVDEQLSLWTSALTDVVPAVPTQDYNMGGHARVNSNGLHLMTHQTTASAANAFIDSTTGRVSRSTSSLRYKTQVESVDPAYNDIMSLRPVWYRSLSEADNPAWGWWGLIAEEVAEIDPRLVHWTYDSDQYEDVDEDGERQLKEGAEPRPDGVQYERLTVLLLDILQRWKGSIESLEARIATLEAKAPD